MFKNEKGLTLIELLITIAVIAVVAAISVPVVSNVIAASNTNSLSAMQEQVDQFVAEAAESGSVSLNGSTLEARIDQNGDGVDEYLVKTFPVDSKYTVSGTGDGPYTIALGGASTGPASYTYNLVVENWTDGPAGDFGGSGSCIWVSFDNVSFYCGVSQNAQDAFATLTVGDPIVLTHYANGSEIVTSTIYFASYANGKLSFTGTLTSGFSSAVPNGTILQF